MKFTERIYSVLKRNIDRRRSVLKELAVPPVWIALLSGLLALAAGEIGKGIVTILSALMFAALWAVTRILRGPSCGAELPRAGKTDANTYLLTLALGGLAVFFGLIAVFADMPAFSTLRDLCGGIGIAVGLFGAEDVVAASCFALNLRMLRGDEVLENSDDPYVLGNADVAVINPDVFSRSDLLPPKFFYAGELRYMSALDADQQRHLIHAAVSCLGDGANINALSELLMKSSRHEADFRLVGQCEEGGVTLSRELQGETPVVFIKGSCADVISRCTHYVYGSRPEPLTKEELASIAKARLTMKKRGCRPFAYAMYTPSSGVTVFLGMVGFGISREGDLKKTVGFMRDAGLDVCFAGTGAREVIFGLAEMCGLSVTRFMTGRELSGRNIPPDAKEIASHRLFAEISQNETEQILEAFRAQKHRPAYIGMQEITCGGSSVCSGFSGRESCEKLMLCIKMRRNAERAAQGFAAARFGLIFVSLFWPVLCAIIGRTFTACVTPGVAIFAGIFGWLSALCVSLMYKNSETPREMGRDRRHTAEKRAFSLLCWSLSAVAVTVPLVSVPLMYPEQSQQAVSLAIAALLMSTALQVFAYGCGISISPSGLLRRHPAAYIAMAAAVALPVLFFSVAGLASSCGFAAVALGAWRMSLPFALVPVFCLGIFLFIEWMRDPQRSDAGGR